MAEWENQFSWSFSRQRTFEGCRREYYYRYYAHWGGWEIGAAAEARQCYLLGKMTNLPALAGSIVHAQIEALLKGIGGGKQYTLAELRYGATKKLSWAIEQSERGLWKRNPKKCCNLLEHYYLGGISAETKAQTESNLLACLDRFVGSEVLASIRQSDPAQWRIEGENKEDEWRVEGVLVWAIPDFAFATEGALVICDWKTGKADESYDKQLGVYGLYAHEHWGYPAEQVILRLFSLGDGVVREQRFSEAQARVARQAIVQSCWEMAGLLDDRSRNIARKDAFPMTADPTRCQRCAFRELCFDVSGEVRRDLTGG